MNLKSVLIRGVNFGGSGLIRGVASFPWYNVHVVVFYYLSESDIYLEKRSELWWEWPYKKCGLFFMVQCTCSSIVLPQ